MHISPADLVPDPLPLDVAFEPGAISYAQDIRQADVLRLTGSAERIEEFRGPRDVVEDIRLRGHLSGTFELLCARCLEPLTQRADRDFDLIFRPVGADAGQGERAISEAETEIGYYEESGLLLEDAVREQVLLSLPDRSLCQEHCKGLCPQCGINLNEASCTCGESRSDPRWAALKGLAVAGTS